MNEPTPPVEESAPQTAGRGSPETDHPKGATAPANSEPQAPPAPLPEVPALILNGRVFYPLTLAVLITTIVIFLSQSPTE